MTASENRNRGEILVHVFRGSAGEGETQSFRVPQRESQTVLDVVTHIQREIDPTLAYRFACRVGVCGSCAMTVNGRPRWTCRTHVDAVAGDGELTLAPLRGFDHVRDLVVDMTEFFEKWRDARGYFKPSDADADDMAVVEPGSAQRQAADAAIECIGCGVCYAACDTVAGDSRYFGPAAINRSWALLNDVRDGAQDDRRSALLSAGGCHRCHSMGNCTAVCPKELDPLGSIIGAKQATVRLPWKRKPARKSAANAEGAEDHG